MAAILIGRHFENNSFPDGGFWGTFSMLIMISNTTQIHWKPFVQCVPEKTEPWNKGMLRPSSGVYDYYHIYFMNYD